MKLSSRIAGAAVALCFSLAGCNGLSSLTPGGPSPSPPPQNFCTNGSSIAAAAKTQERTARRAVSKARGGPAYVPGMLEVVYDRGQFVSGHPQISAVSAALHAQIDSELDFNRIGSVVQILRVTPGKEEAAMAQLRAQRGVKSVSRTPYRHLLSTTAFFTNDPYFQGFPPDNVAPFYMSSNSPGQWDMHVLNVEQAWGYGNSNSTGTTYPGALGGTVPVAIVDTGADTSHPELCSHITYTETVLNGSVTTDDMHDNDGHGTDVAGIAAALGNNGLGFAGVAYNVPLMIFRVFPDPPSGGCPPQSTSDQCSASAADIAKAINHAVSHGAKVINLSLGSPQRDSAEENAVANAIASGVVVVAAAGNDGTSQIDYPARDPGAIAVGASALNDPRGAPITEKVASYSNWSGSNPSGWGVVAPGGDPCPGAGSACNDNDDLHWIENIWTSTAADGSSSGACTPDHDSTSGTIDCRILIAGTSQATPHVAGAAALLLSVKSSLSPSQVMNALCTTAVPIPGGKAGCGRIDAYHAMAKVIGDPNP